nr:phosphodiesterase [uncultured Cetobacterium sp.]
MKIFVISDIHGSSFYLKKALEAFEKERCDYILILGDELYHGPRNPLPEEYDPKKVVELLNPLKNLIVAVRGNCDSEVDQMLLEYPIMGDYSTILWEGKRIFSTHGHIYNKENLPPISKGDILIYGHTHIPLCEENEEGVYILNPGSISLPKGGYENSYGVFEDGKFLVKTLEGEIINSIQIEKK